MSTPISERELKAATSCMVIVEESPGLYDVCSDDRGPYTVDPDFGVCECPNHQYRDVDRSIRIRR